eukprot:sb/3474320/
MPGFKSLKPCLTFSSTSAPIGCASSKGLLITHPASPPLSTSIIRLPWQLYRFVPIDVFYEGAVGRLDTAERTTTSTYIYNSALSQYMSFKFAGRNNYSTVVPPSGPSRRDNPTESSAPSGESRPAMDQPTLCINLLIGS